MTAAPVSAESLAQALLPFGEGTMLPASAYTSEAVLAWERRNLFAASWTCVGRVEAVFADGATQVATTVGDIPVVLARDPSGVSRGDGEHLPAPRPRAAARTGPPRPGGPWSARTTRGATTCPGR